MGRKNNRAKQAALTIYPNAAGEYVPAQRLTFPELAALPEALRSSALAKLDVRLERLADGRLRVAVAQ